MILNAVLFGHGSHEAAWRAPGVRATAPLELRHWVACARAAEAAGFDGLFLGDILCLQDRPEHHPCEALDPFSLAWGRRFRVLCIIDDFSRECLGAVVDTSISGQRVARELDRIAELRGYPCMVVSDNGTELTSNAILTWQQDRKVEWHYIAPGKPMRDTASSRASMAACATNASTSTCSPVCAMPDS